MSGFSDFLGKAGGSAEQLFIWGVLQQVIGALILPFVQALQQVVLETDPNTPLSPADAATMAARKIIDTGAGADQAKKSGISPDLFADMVTAAGSAPDVSTVFELFRRGLIDTGSAAAEDVSVYGALTDSGLRAQWLPLLEKLAVQIPTVAEVMNAWLEGQISEDEARTRYLAAGGDPTWFQTSYNANGQAPTPSQALELLNRGIIPERGTGPNAISYEQAFLEGPWRNKWLEPFVALRNYYPPPRTVTAMYHAGQLTHDQAAGYLAKQGLDATLVEAYLKPATHSTTSTDKHLAKTDILGLYKDKLITRTQAIGYLTNLHYSQADAQLIIDLADVNTAASAIRSQVSRIRTLFLAGKLSITDAKAALAELNVPTDQATELVDTWSVPTAETTKTLSAAQIEGAYYYNLIRGEDAMTLLQALGYDEFDAWLALAVRVHGPLADVPRPASPYPAPPKPAA